MKNVGKSLLALMLIGSVAGVFWMRSAEQKEQQEEKEASIPGR